MGRRMIQPMTALASSGEALRLAATDAGLRTGRMSRRSSAPEWLRGHILFLDLGWLDFTRTGVLRESIAAGHPVLRIRPRKPAPDRLLEAWPAWDATYRGARLWEICRYELCMKYDCSVQALEERVAASPPDRAASDTVNAAKVLIDWAVAALDFYQPRTVMFQQGYILPAAAMREVARARGLPVVGLENTFRKDRICWDDITGISLATPIPARIFADERGAGGDEYLRRYRDSAGALKSRQHATLGESEVEDWVGRKILFIGQVNTDSSVLFHIGKGFPDQMAAVDVVADHVLSEPDSLLFLKVHPKEVTGRNPLRQRYSMERYARFLRREGVAGSDRIRLDDQARIDIMSAIEWADVCVTINSQAGLEAAALGKSVILCGTSSYDHLRSVRRVETPSELRAALADRAPPVDAGEARDFFRVYCECYCKPARVESLIDLAGPAPQRRGRGWRALHALLWAPSVLLKAGDVVWKRLK